MKLIDQYKISLNAVHALRNALFTIRNDIDKLIKDVEEFARLMKTEIIFNGNNKEEKNEN